VFEPAEAKRILDRLECHYTPIHGSWLNMAEIEFSVLSRQCLDQRIPDSTSLECKVTDWEDHRNQAEATVKWRFTTMTRASNSHDSIHQSMLDRLLAWSPPA
jgi:hypothetical protein